MSRSTPAQLEHARRLLAHEEATGTPDSATTAAGRLYDKLHAHLAPLVGVAGVQLLFVRSAKLAQGEFEWLSELSSLERATKLRDRLHVQDPPVAADAAADLFGTFFALVTTFIGDRLTTQILRGAWPTLEETAVMETKQ